MNKLVGTQRGYVLQVSDRARAESPGRPARVEGVDKVPMGWSRNAMFFVFTAATVAGIWSLQPYPQAGVTSTVACYVALANDLTPLLRPGTPDVAASSPECATQTTLDKGRLRDPDAVASSAVNDNSAKTPRPPTRRRDAATSASAAAASPSPLSIGARRGTCRDDADIVGDLITQCGP